MDRCKTCRYDGFYNEFCDSCDDSYGISHYAPNVSTATAELKAKVERLEKKIARLITECGMLEGYVLAGNLKTAQEFAKQLGAERSKRILDALSSPPAEPKGGDA